MTDRLRQPPGSHRDGYRADEQVDQEHPAPAIVGTDPGDDQAAEQRADRGGDADDGPEHAERLGPGRAGERVLDRRADRGEEQAGAQALHDPAHDDLSLTVREAAGDTGKGEDGEPDEEQPLVPEPVARPAARHQSEAVGKRITGDDPFQAGR